MYEAKFLNEFYGIGFTGKDFAKAYDEAKILDPGYYAVIKCKNGFSLIVDHTDNGNEIRIEELTFDKGTKFVVGDNVKLSFRPPKWFLYVFDIISSEIFYTVDGVTKTETELKEELLFMLKDIDAELNKTAYDKFVLETLFGKLNEPEFYTDKIGSIIKVYKFGEGRFIVSETIDSYQIKYTELEGDFKYVAGNTFVTKDVDVFNVKDEIPYNYFDTIVFTKEHEKDVLNKKNSLAYSEPLKQCPVYCFSEFSDIVDNSFKSEKEALEFIKLAKKYGFNTMMNIDNMHTFEGIIAVKPEKRKNDVVINVNDTCYKIKDYRYIELVYNKDNPASYVHFLLKKGLKGY